MSIAIKISPQEKNLLFQLIRWSIERGLQSLNQAKQAEVLAFIEQTGVKLDPQSALMQNLGAFVTLHKNHNLRGCIGNIIANQALIFVVSEMAFAAAFHDYRFGALQAEEYPLLSLELSVLGTLSLCTDLNAIELGKHGLLLHYRGHQGVFLPQVATEQGWTKEEYLNQLCYKASLPAGTHLLPEAKIYCYEALVLQEKD